MGWFIAVLSVAVGMGGGAVIGRESAPSEAGTVERRRTKASVWVARACVVAAAGLGNLLGALIGFVVGAGIGVARR